MVVVDDMLKCGLYPCEGGLQGSGRGAWRVERDCTCI